MIFLLCSTLPHNVFKDSLIDLFERNVQREGSPYLAKNDRNTFFTLKQPIKYHEGTCENICDALIFLLDIFILFSTKTN